MVVVVAVAVAVPPLAVDVRAALMPQVVDALGVAVALAVLERPPLITLVDVRIGTGTGGSRRIPRPTRRPS